MFSPYEYWQFWRNTDDKDVFNFLKFFTDLDLSKINYLKDNNEDINKLKILLANKTTTMLHGERAAIDSEETAKKVDSEVKKIVETGYERAKQVLTEKIDDLHKIAKALLTYETLTGEEIEDIINKNKYPESKQELANDDDSKDSALGSIGLKPKIVH